MNWRQKAHKVFQPDYSKAEEGMVFARDRAIIANSMSIPMPIPIPTPKIGGQ